MRNSDRRYRLVTFTIAILLTTVSVGPSMGQQPKPLDSLTPEEVQGEERGDVQYFDFDASEYWTSPRFLSVSCRTCNCGIVP